MAYSALSIDTNVLYKHGFDFEHGLVGQLARLAKSPTPLLLTDVVRREFLKHVREQTDKTHETLTTVEAVRARLEYMPLRKPTEVDRELMEALLFYSNSLLGRMFGLLERAAIQALDQEECLSASLIATVALRGRRDEDG